MLLFQMLIFRLAFIGIRVEDLNLICGYLVGCGVGRLRRGCLRVTV